MLFYVLWGFCAIGAMHFFPLLDLLPFYLEIFLTSLKIVGKIHK